MGMSANQLPTSVRLSKELVARIDKERRRRGWNRGSVIQACLENYLPVLEGEVFGKPVLPREGETQDMELEPDERIDG